MLKIQIEIPPKLSVRNLMCKGLKWLRLKEPAFFRIFRHIQTGYLKTTSSKNSRILFEAESIVAG